MKIIRWAHWAMATVGAVSVGCGATGGSSDEANPVDDSLAAESDAFHGRRGVAEVLKQTNLVADEGTSRRTSTRTS